MIEEDEVPEGSDDTLEVPRGTEQATTGQRQKDPDLEGQLWKRNIGMSSGGQVPSERFSKAKDS